ncbi:MAG: 50S ribosomal protein L2, large subunit ribosomal protein L2 [archaeon GW2011_AR9]|nr:50S ribosomal protein L2, large subunit ribosomal protein L2 [uncultured archaeon]KHO50225.1 MAG: 50S ribosomal protein L2, large subunit ribosomal protein L2 [archaeon GW2011_AR9]MBS3120263.1 50S ribosomal protein L2 [Candidatus Woesearchaeota archaeon]HIG92960.1 50S ribosomal protein L2 [Candidatus Woesearchaeota archaeon]HIH12693.1 50S ribosomal protein L2 [Candidatus Woesearchaeota archaeon]
MGKNLIQQRRGRGTMRYRSPGFRFLGEVRHIGEDTQGRVVDVVHCPGHSTPLMEVSYITGNKELAFAPEGVRVGDIITAGPDAIIKEGNILPLRSIPEGTLIHNIELRPGDGGKMVRASGTFAKVVAKTDKEVRVKLPSRQEKSFLPDCRAAIGLLSGAGRLDKPFVKAGTRWKRMRARNKLYPIVCGISMNAVDHPFGGKCSHIKGRPTQSPRNAPPGRKVGKIAPRHTGRNK